MEIKVKEPLMKVDLVYYWGWGVYLFYLYQNLFYWRGPPGHAYLGSCFEMFIVRTAMFEVLRPD